MSTFTYPEARRDESLIEDYHGVKIADPYRWLEQPDSEETNAFIDLQNNITHPFINQCSYKDQFRQKLTQMWDYPKYGCPARHGDKWHYWHNTGLQNQSVLYIQDSLQSEGRVFLDVNEMSSEGTTSCSSNSFSEDGKYMAYTLSESGSDWVSIRVRDTETGQDLPDIIPNCKFTSLSWNHDNNGFFYNVFPTDNQSRADGTETDGNFNQSLRYHRLGTDVQDDLICAQWPENPKWSTHASVSDCGVYVVCSMHEGTQRSNRLYISKFCTRDGVVVGIEPFLKVIDNFEAEYSYITNDGSLFVFQTNLNAPNYKVITMDIENGGKQETLVEESSADVLEWCSCVDGDKLLLCHLHDVKSVLTLHSLKTGQKLASLPLDIGSVGAFSGERKYSEIFYKLTSFLTPGTIFYLDLKQTDWTPKVHRQIEVEHYDASKFEVKQVFYDSLDEPAVKIPMFIISKKGITLDSSHPVLLYGYGGFSISITPSFSLSRILFINNMGGVLAIPNIRGGGEYGDLWHKAGTFLQKQNVFNDFQAAASYLVAQQYTTANKLAIMGGSNGGLLVAACANQRPDLYGCVIGKMGVMDMLRYQKFTIGHAWTTEFGSSDSKEHFDNLIKYSPLHNVHPLPHTFPATLLFTGDHDDRVVPLHTLKLLATLQHVHGKAANQTKPIMARIDTKSGHGAGCPATKQIDESTDMHAFMANCMQLTWTP